MYIIRGQGGIAALINPTFQRAVTHLQHNNPLLQKYVLSIIVEPRILIQIGRAHV